MNFPIKKQLMVTNQDGNIEEFDTREEAINSILDEASDTLIDMELNTDDMSVYKKIAHLEVSRDKSGDENECEVIGENGTFYVKIVDETNKEEYCEWTEDDSKWAIAIDYKTSCGKNFSARPFSGGNDSFEYCPYCGKKIILNGEEE